MVDTFLLLYTQSLDLSLKNIDDTAVLVSGKMGGFPVSVLKEAIENTDYIYFDAIDVRDQVENYVDTIKLIDEKLVGNVNYETFFYQK